MHIITYMHLYFALIIFLKCCSEVNMLSFYQLPNLPKFFIILLK